MPQALPDAADLPALPILVCALGRAFSSNPGKFAETDGTNEGAGKVRAFTCPHPPPIHVSYTHNASYICVIPMCHTHVAYGHTHVSYTHNTSYPCGIPMWHTLITRRTHVAYPCGTPMWHTRVTHPCGIPM